MMAALGVAGYGVGTLAIYPGRTLSVTTVMVNITLWATGGDMR